MANEHAAMLVENERRRLSRLMDERRQDIAAAERDRDDANERHRAHHAALLDLTTKYATLTGSLTVLGVDAAALAKVEGYAGQQGGLSDEARRACIAEYHPSTSPLRYKAVTPRRDTQP